MITNYCDCDLPTHRYLKNHNGVQTKTILLNRYDSFEWTLLLFLCALRHSNAAKLCATDQ